MTTAVKPTQARKPVAKKIEDPKPVINEEYILGAIEYKTRGQLHSTLEIQNMIYDEILATAKVFVIAYVLTILFVGILKGVVNGR